jgi:hypothetical protein
MTARSLQLVFAVGVVVLSSGCNAERKEECEKFLAAMKPLDQGTPTAELVDRVEKDVGAIQFQDQPLGVFAKNYRATLTVLSNTLKLQASPSAPDGTDDVVKTKVKEARTDKDDTARYCSQ